MSQKISFLSLLFIFFVALYPDMVSADQFRFSDLENYSTSGDVGQQEAQLNSHALEYAKEHFPIGSLAARAVLELTRAGAQCSVGDDPNDQPGYICIWTRHGYGLNYFVVQVEWIIGIDTDLKYIIVRGVSASRGENSF